MTDVTQGDTTTKTRMTSGGTSWPSPTATKKGRNGGSTNAPAELLEVRRKHGYKPTNGQVRTSAKGWRDDVLSGKISLDGIKLRDAVPGEWPRNARVLEELKRRFGVLGFDWMPVERVVKGRHCKWVELKNPPKIGGYTPNLADLLVIEPDMVDGYEQVMDLRQYADRINRPACIEVEATRERMVATGVGYKGLEGVSWRQMIDPFVLPGTFLDNLGAIGRALTLGFQAIYELYNKDYSLRRLLSEHKPPRIPEMMLGSHVGLMRPDIVILKDLMTGELRPIITELESCPGGQGMAHAMEVGYGLPTTMLDSYIRMLCCRKFIVFSTNEWAEYCWEQATFVAALRSAGVDAQIWFDKPLSDIHARVQKDWIAPAAMSASARAAWNTDFLGRLRKHGFLEFVHGSDEGLPDTLGSDTVVYRFGYVDNFVNTGAIKIMERWHEQGAYLMNPLWYTLESKTLMAAFWHPSVETWIRERDPQALIDLQNGVAQTHSIMDDYPLEVRNVREEWLTKIAAWDGDNKSWGSRGVDFGSQAQSDRAWQQHLGECRTKPHPIVVQRFIKSERWSVAYRNATGLVDIDRSARTRLTPFFLFHEDGTVELAGSTITLRSGSLRIHGADDASEGPTIYTMEG